VTGLAVIVASALMILTTRLHETTTNLAASIESVRLAEEAEVGLLMYGRTRETPARAGLAEDLRHNLSEARRYVTSEEEQASVALAAERVSALLDSTYTATEAATRESLAYDALEKLIDVNFDESKRLQAGAARSDSLANVIGIVTILLLVTVGAAVLWWLRKRAFQPVLDLADAMERFGRGDRQARAPENGPQELRDMVVRFNQMASALAAQHGAQTAFLGGVAHDLRNPLMVLLLQLEFVAPDRPLPEEAVVRRTFDIIARQIGRIERMLGDLVDMAKIEAGTFELKIADVDIVGTVRDVVELFETTSPRHPIRVLSPAESIMIRCDPLRIEQVVTNLVSNAIKYSPLGGSVEIDVRVVASELMIAVTDKGMGISEDDRRRLFEPFRRGAATDNIPGAGLGLFVVRRIIEAHHGRIEVDSTVGEGSTFRIFLPVQDASQPLGIRARGRLGRSRLSRLPASAPAPTEPK
jgi:signal transduction histidine kinase